MADEDALVDDDGETKKGGGKGLMILALINTLGLLGLAAFVVMGGSEAAAEAPESMAESTEGGEAAKPSGEPGPTLELGTVVVNLSEPTGTRYLRAKILLELDAEESKAEVELRLSQIRYRITSLLSAQRVADVTGPDNMEALRKAMTKRANGVLARGKVVAVWPDEWIVQ